MKYKTRSAAETKKVARIFAEEVASMPLRKRAFVVLLKGDLGAGKTTFIQGLLRELGVKKKIVSPTFALLRSYVLSYRAQESSAWTPASAEVTPKRALSYRRRPVSSPLVFKTTHHFDCYRIGDEKEMKELGFAELIKDPQNIILIEWPERIRKAIPREKVTVTLTYGDTINERIIEVK